ncbi:MAG: hypothetical protein MK135_14305, partial [Polyangiaceae bacterium]|nr:hypothetical protein [Polyangiaceae bacterium]
MKISRLRRALWVYCTCFLWGELSAASAFAQEELGSFESSSQADTEGYPLRFIPLSLFNHQDRRIMNRLRVHGSAAGEGQVSIDYFPDGGEPQGYRIPRSQGGGFLFLQPLAGEYSATTGIWRAETWTAPLEPFVRVPGLVRSVAFGGDRIYLSNGQLVLDAQSGELLASDLPAVVQSDRLFVNGERVLIESPILGLLGSRDGGRHFEVLGPDLRLLQGELLRVTGPQGPGTLDKFLRYQPFEGGRSGRAFRGVAPNLSPGHVSTRAAPPRSKGQSSGAAARHQARVLQLAERNFSSDLLELIQEGALVRPGSAFEGHQLVRVKEGRASTLTLDRKGRVVFDEYAVEEGLNCGNAGRGLLYCRGDVTSLLAVNAPPANNPAKGGLLVRRLAQVSNQNQALAADQGVVLLPGGCEHRPGALQDQTQTFCRISATGVQELTWPGRLPDGPLAYGVNESQTFAFALRPEGLRFFDLGLGVARDLPFPDDQSLRDLLLQGQLLPQAFSSQSRPGIWLTSGEDFVGIVLEEGAILSAGVIQRPLRRAFLSAERAAIWGASGFLKLSIDGGQNFRTRSYPWVSGDPEPAHSHEEFSRPRLGCGEAGCVLGQWLQLGWWPEQEEPIQPSLPELRRPPPSGVGRFLFHCRQRNQATLKAAKGPSSSKRLAQAADPTDFLTQFATSFSAFGDLRFRQLSSQDVGIERSLRSGVARFVVEGPRRLEWGDLASSRIDFVNPFRPLQTESSADTPGLFPTSRVAAESLGHLERASRWTHLAFDAKGDSGLALMRSKSGVTLVWFSKEQPLRVVRAPSRLRRLLSFAQTSQGAFLLYQNSNELHLAQVGDELS